VSVVVICRSTAIEMGMHVNENNLLVINGNDIELHVGNTLEWELSYGNGTAKATPTQLWCNPPQQRQ